MWNKENSIYFKKLIQPVSGAGIGFTLGEMALEGVTMHAIPWLGKKAVGMGRYGASELMRNKNLQKKAVNFALDKSKPFLENTASQMLDSLSTKIRPDKKYKTGRKDLDGRGLGSGFATSLVSPHALRGGLLDIHKGIGKTPKTQKRFYSSWA